MSFSPWPIRKPHVFSYNNNATIESAIKSIFFHHTSQAQFWLCWLYPYWSNRKIRQCTNREYYQSNKSVHTCSCAHACTHTIWVKCLYWVPSYLYLVIFIRTYTVIPCLNHFKEQPIPKQKSPSLWDPSGLPCIHFKPLTLSASPWIITHPNLMIIIVIWAHLNSGVHDPRKSGNGHVLGSRKK